MGEMVSGYWAASAVAASAVAGPAAGAAMLGAAAAQAAANAGGSGGGGGSGAHFAVDRDQIPGLIKELEQARDKLERAASVAREAGRWPAPGTDPYSPKAAERMGPQLVDNYLAANKRQQQDIKNMIQSLEAAMKSYDNADESARSSFQKRG
ncbi:hypothetical protein GCM10012275_32980 [Longimycelium tulufanense]|uniref:PE family protein n=1 Tax=Longimycelium tulufanense TaxID=907463 RepID=A0A8J3FX56_9PSEU|nr:hypothetical protein [Longimycelium tulufanense]GGM59179.1 hypothetical protein GCM10012275_32980 [Longimycelium tulufanense]